jgi:hypothetical protein
MNTTQGIPMELDELKGAWQVLDRRLEQQAALNLHIFKAGKLDKMQSSLRPLFWGQAIQMVIGLIMSLWAAMFWLQHRDVPHLLIAGVIVHVSGLYMIILGAVMLALISRIDYSGPVLTLQRQLAQLRRVYVRGGLIVGLAWSILWIPYTGVFFEWAFGVDLFANAPSFLYIGIGIGIAVVLGTWLVRRWSAGRPQLRQKLDAAATGTSLLRAQRLLDEIEQFEHS